MFRRTLQHICFHIQTQISNQKEPATLQAEVQENKTPLSEDQKKSFLFLCSKTVPVHKKILKAFQVRCPVLRPVQIGRCFRHVEEWRKNTNREAGTLLESNPDWKYERFRELWYMKASIDTPSLEYIYKVAGCNSSNELPEDMHASFHPQRVRPSTGTALTLVKRKRDESKPSQRGPSALKLSSRGSSDAGSEDNAEAEEKGGNSGSRSAGERAPRAPNFSLSEFARLFLYLQGDEAIRAALLNSGKALARREIDAGVKRKDFWVDTVEPAFNQDLDGPKLDFKDICPFVDPTTLPQVERSGKKLEIVYASFRSMFQRLYRDYKKSGQNNPDWDEFLRCRNISWDSAACRQLRMFGCICNIGSNQEDSDFISVFVKTMPATGNLMGTGGWEGGSGDCGSRGELLRKKRRMSMDSKLEEMVTTYSSTSKATINAAERLSDHLQPNVGGSARNTPDGRQQLMKDRIEWLAQYRSCCNMLKEAESSFEKEKLAEQCEMIEDYIKGLDEKLREH